ncbi:MAG: prepilin-type N-terminal cleavage/methylation domain-containing protein [Candidatus Eremiobacterota bacterium]
MVESRPRGFSLVEMLLVVLLVSLMLGLTWVNLRPAKAKAASQAAAETLAGFLRGARHQAQARGVPVGVGLPTAGATQPHCTAFYLVEGAWKPRVTRVVDLRGECPGALVFCGHWSLDGGLTHQLGPVAAGSAAERFDLTSWDPPAASDSLFVFTPTGSVVSNRPHFDGAYHIVVSAGLSYATGSVAGVPDFELTGVSAPWTVTLTGSGDVSLTAGVARGSSVARLSGPGEGGGAPRPDFPAPGPNSDPSLSVSALPQPVPNTAPPGVDMTLRVDSFMTLKAIATDADGDPLTCRWTATGGTFSHTQPAPMEWDPDAGHRVSHWVWIPPPTDPPNTRYRLTCQVEDGRGGVATARVGVVGQLESLPTQRVAVSATTPAGNEALYLVNPDGTEPSPPLTPATLNVHMVRWSPDAEFMLYCVYPAIGDIYRVDRDRPGESVLLTTVPQTEGLSYLDFSPDGTRVYALTLDSTRSYLYSFAMDNPSNVSFIGDFPRTFTSFSANCVICSSADGSLLLRTAPGLVRVDPTTGASTPVPPPAGFAEAMEDPSFAPGGTRLAWGSPSGLYYADYDPAAGTLGTAVQVVARQPGTAPTWSPDGETLIFDDVGTGNLVRVRRDGTGLVNLPGPWTYADHAVWSAR